MKSHVFMLCGLVLCFASAYVQARDLTQTDATCVSTSSIEIIVRGGKCDAKAVVSCEASAESKSAFEAAFVEWWAEDFDSYVCDTQRREAAARAVAVATAKLAASAFAQISCSEKADAEGCAWGVGEGDAWAIATADAIAQAMVDFGGDRAFCEADVRALSAAVVDVAGSAQADACIKGGGLTLVDFESIYVSGFQKAIAEAFALATASFCDTGDSVTSSSKCKGQGASLGGGGVTIVGDGQGSGRADKPPACVGGGAAKCCKRDYSASKCLCRDAGCPWTRTSDFDEKTNIRRTWNAKDGAKCFCA